tara:strand:+ start:181950 stop:182378 length:429 start_codon:yes stop_codon:yes gene_type:complete
MQAGHQFTGKPDRTEFLSGEIQSKFLELRLDYLIIKIYIVRHKNGIGRNIHYPLGDIPQFWGAPHHLVVYARKARDKVGNFTFRIHQGRIFVHHGITLYLKDGYFGYPIPFYAIAGGFYIDDGVQHTICPLPKFWHLKLMEK